MEKRISDLMTPASAYRRVYEDEPVQRVVRVLRQSLLPGAPQSPDHGHRSVLVCGRGGAFLGCIRLNDILELLVPPGSEEMGTPFEAGMLATRCKLMGGMTASEVLGEQRFVDVEAPLMEAVRVMVDDGLINIPVLKRGELVGILTDKSLLNEICDHLGGGRFEEQSAIAEKLEKRGRRSG